MADLAKAEPILIEFLTAGVGYSRSELASSLWTDELLDSYYWDAVEWRITGKPSLAEWNPSSGVINPVRQAQAVEITPTVEFWMSEQGEAAGGVIDALGLPEIAGFFSRLGPIVKLLALFIAIGGMILLVKFLQNPEPYIRLLTSVYGG